MPNWCANRLFIRGNVDGIQAVQSLMSGDIAPGWHDAGHQSIQLFVAGCAGILRPVKDIHYAPYPALAGQGPGARSPENIAFTHWVDVLEKRAVLSPAICRAVHQWWEESGLALRTWETLSASVSSNGIVTRPSS